MQIIFIVLLVLFDLFLVYQMGQLELTNSLFQLIIYKECSLIRMLKLVHVNVDKAWSLPIDRWLVHVFVYILDYRGSSNDVRKTQTHHVSIGSDHVVSTIIQRRRILEETSSGGTRLDHLYLFVNSKLTMQVVWPHDVNKM